MTAHHDKEGGACASAPPTFDDIIGLLGDQPVEETVLLLRRVLLDAGLPPVPIKNAVTGDKRTGKAPKGAAWQEEAREALPECCRFLADSDALGTGIALHGQRAVDVDVDDDSRAAACREIVERHLGASPAVRCRARSPRRVLLYRAAEGEPPKKLVVNSTTEERVEVLGAGQQVVAYAHHYSGADMYWQGMVGFEVSRADLPAVTEDRIDAALAECAAVIGADPPRPARVVVDDGWRPAVQAAGDMPIADVIRCLDCIPNIGGKVSYEFWLRIGMAVHHATGGSAKGLEAWRDWSGGDPACVGKWRTFGGGSVTAGTLVHEARQHDPGLRLPPRPWRNGEMPSEERVRAALKALKSRRGN